MKPTEAAQMMDRIQTEYDAFEIQFNNAVNASDWREAERLKLRKHFLQGQLSILARLTTKQSNG